MIKRIILGSSLGAVCRSKVDRQLNIVLASVHWQILQLEINLQRVNTPDHAGGEVVVVDRGHGAGEVMFGALHRTKSAISRELKKRRRMKRRGLPHHDDLSNQILMGSS